MLGGGGASISGGPSDTAIPSAVASPLATSDSLEVVAGRKGVMGEKWSAVGFSESVCQKLFEPVELSSSASLALPIGSISGASSVSVLSGTLTGGLATAAASSPTCTVRWPARRFREPPGDGAAGGGSILPLRVAGAATAPLELRRRFLAGFDAGASPRSIPVRFSASLRSFST